LTLISANPKQVAKLREQKRELERTLRKQAEELAAEKAVTKQVGSLEPLRVAALDPVIGLSLAAA
jgi:hypothetical protein